MHDAVHEETVRSGRTMVVFGLSTIALVVAITALVVTVPAGWQDWPPSPSDVAVLVVSLGLALAVGVGVALMRLEVRVDEVLEVRVRPWWYRRRIAPAQITSAAAVEMTPGNSNGWGIRLVGGGTAVLLDSGPGVQVTIAGARSLRFRCNDPEAVVEALRVRGAPID